MGLNFAGTAFLINRQPELNYSSFESGLQGKNISQRVAA